MESIEILIGALGSFYHAYPVNPDHSDYGDVFPMEGVKGNNYVTCICNSGRRA